MLGKELPGNRRRIDRVGGVAQELGVIGAFCFVGMIYWYFRGLKGKPDTSEDVLAWRRAFIASGVGTLVCCWFLSRQYISVLYMLLALGASAAILDGSGDEDVPVTARDLKMVAAWTLGGIVLVYLSIRTMAVWS